MSRYTIICHRCGKSTFVDLSKTISDQRCRACRGFLQGVEVQKEVAGDVKRKLVYRTSGGVGKEPEWQDQETPVVAIHRRWPRFFIFVVALGTIGYLGIIGYGAFQKFRNSRGGTFQDYGQLIPDKPDVRLTPEWRTRATDLAKKALAATTADELLPLLYHPEVSDDVIRNYYSTREKLPLGKNLQEDYYVPPGDMTENAVAFWFEDAADRTRSLVVVEKPTGMVVDWPSLVGYGEMPLDEYLKAMPPQTVVVRARARIGEYYNDHFSNAKAWLSIRLADVTDETVIHGYISRENPVARLMETAFPDPLRDKVARPDEPVIVVLRQPTGNFKADQTEIISLESRTWYQQNGLKPILEHLRALEKLNPANPGDAEKPAPEKPAADKPPADKPPADKPPVTPGTPAPGGSGN